MKIIFISFFDNFGGTENFIQNLVKKLNFKDFIIVSINNFDKRFKKYPKFKYISLNIKPGNNLISRVIYIFKVIKKIRKLIDQQNPTTFLSFKNRVNVLSSIAISSFPRLNSIACERTVVIEEQNIFWKLMRKLNYKNFKHIVTQDKFSSVWLKKNCLKLKDLNTIPNYLNLFKSSNKNKIFIKKNIEKKNIIISIGRLVETKQFSVLIDIFSKISKSNKDWILVILGDGPEKIKLMKKINDLDLRKKILLPGWVSNVDYWLKKSKIFAFTSRLEGFPNSLQQAVFRKKPSVAFDCLTGPSQLIDNNKNGFLIKLNDTEEFTKKLNLLMSNKRLRDKFSKNTKKIILKFDEKKIITKWKRIIT